VVDRRTPVVEGKGDGHFSSPPAPWPPGAGFRIGPPCGSARGRDPSELAILDATVAIRRTRQELGFRTDLQSDLASVQATYAGGRAGRECPCGTSPAVARSRAHWEIARGVGRELRIQEAAVRFRRWWASACALLGLDPVAMATKAARPCSYPPPRRSKPCRAFRPSSPKARSSARWRCR